MEIVKAVLDTLVVIAVLVALGLGVKYWIDKGMDKFLHSQVGEVEKINAKLRRELKAFKKIEKMLQETIEHKQLEIESLIEKVEELKHQQVVLDKSIDNTEDN